MKEFSLNVKRNSFLPFELYKSRRKRDEKVNGKKLEFESFAIGQEIEEWGRR